MLIFSVFGFVNSFSQMKIDSAGKIRINFGINYYASSSFYNLSNTQVIDLRYIDSTINRKYIFESKRYGINLGFAYSLTDYLQLSAEIPMSIFQLKETFESDTDYTSPTYNQTAPKMDSSIFSIHYYELGAKLKLSDDRFYSFALLSLRVPPKFRNGLQTSPTSSLQYYSNYQVFAGLTGGYKWDKSYIQSSVIMNFRSGDFKNQMLFNLEGGFTSVPDTYLKGYTRAGISLEPYTNAIPLSLNRNVFQEDYLNFGVDFDISFTKHIDASFSYEITLLGKNTMSDGIFWLKLGIVP